VNELRVWAPRGNAVDLVVNSSANHERQPMIANDRGWWSAAIVLPPGTDYAFAVDNNNPLPDPRSPWQPAGPHGPSRTVDHSAFAWSDRRWQAPALATAVIYELHIGTFTQQGTFESALSKLEYLVRIGVTHVELMPVAEFPGDRGWGYDGVDLFAPHHAYGGPENLKRFVDACHSIGLAVLLDVVYNHLGPDGNYLASFGPYFTDEYHTPWGPAINFDGPDSIEVRRFFCDNALMWLRDYHFDGLRLDAIHAIRDASAIHFLEQLAAEVRALEKETRRHYDLIAENDLNDARVVTPVANGGYGLDAQWNDDFHHALHTVLTGERLGYYADFGKLSDLSKTLSSVYVYDGRESTYRKRIQGRPVKNLSGHNFVAFLQNHDQIGNRAAGDRIGQLLSLRQTKIGAALVLCAPFVPLLFQGEEFAATTPFLYFTDHQNPEIASAVSVGRRNEFASFGWKPEDVPDPQAVSTFEASKLNWTEPEREPHEDILRWYRALIALRRSTPALRDGLLTAVNVDCSENEKWLVLYRGTVAVICNFAGTRQSISLQFTGFPLLSSDSDFVLADSTIELPAESVVILGQKESSE
jgi:maltooligosyltrehalose trehalohydrolase